MGATRSRKLCIWQTCTLIISLCFECILFKLPKNKSHRTHVSRAHKPHITRRTRLWPIARAPGLPLGGISGLGPDRSESRKSIASLFRLFKSIFEAVLPFFWRSEGPRDFPRSVIRSLPSISDHTRRRGDLCGSELKGITAVLMPNIFE